MRYGEIVVRVQKALSEPIFREEPVQRIEIREGAERAESRKDHRQPAGLAELKESSPWHVAFGEGWHLQKLFGV